MTNKEFQELALSKVHHGPFEPMVLYNPDDDSLEVLISNESHRTQLVVPHFRVYYGRNTGEITGALITGITRFIKDISKELPDIAVSILTGKFKVVHLFRAIRERSQKEKPTMDVVFYKMLEKKAEELNLEADIGQKLIACP